MTVRPGVSKLPPKSFLDEFYAYIFFGDGRTVKKACVEYNLWMLSPEPPAPSPEKDPSPEHCNMPQSVHLRHCLPGGPLLYNLRNSTKNVSQDLIKLFLSPANKPTEFHVSGGRNANMFFCVFEFWQDLLFALSLSHFLCFFFCLCDFSMTAGKCFWGKKNPPSLGAWPRPPYMQT